MCCVFRCLVCRSNMYYVVWRRAVNTHTIHLKMHEHFAYLKIHSTPDDGSVYCFILMSLPIATRTNFPIHVRIALIRAYTSRTARHTQDDGVSPDICRRGGRWWSEKGVHAARVK